MPSPELAGVPDLAGDSVGNDSLHAAYDTRTPFDPLTVVFGGNNPAQASEVARAGDAKVVVYQRPDGSEFVGFVNVTQQMRRELGLVLESSGSSHFIGFSAMTPQIREWISGQVRGLR